MWRGCGRADARAVPPSPSLLQAPALPPSPVTLAALMSARLRRAAKFSASPPGYRVPAGEKAAGSIPAEEEEGVLRRKR